MRRLFAVLILLTGCNLYWNQGDDDCKGGGWADDVAPAQELRNPETGNCEPYGGGYGGCDSTCGPCAGLDTAGGAAIANPDWGSCYSQCNGLDEGGCLAASGCLAAYWEDTSILDAPATTYFRGCFETAPSGPISTGTCWSLDAQACSRHDNCAMYYDEGANALVPGDFTHCAPEPSTAGCSNVDCGNGYHCEDQCKACPPNADCAGTTCTSMCVPDGNSCATVDCGPGYECVETCNGGTPTMGAGMPQVGQCYPTCAPVTACEALTTEAACSARGDCTTVYNGEDCTCYPNQGCTCQILTYDHCESLTAKPL